MKWWNNQILLGVCTVVGGVAAIGYFSEKLAAIIHSKTTTSTSSGLHWFEIVIGVVIIFVPYAIIQYVLVNSRKNLREKTKSIPCWSPVAEHYINGFDSWKLGLAGFLLRLRGQLFVIILAFIFLLYVRWIWPNLNFLHFNYTLTLSSSNLIKYVIPFLVSTYLISLTIKRYLYIKKANKKKLIKKLSDTLDCDVSKTEIASISFGDICNRACEIIASYFRIVVNDSSIHCVMKVAIAEEDYDDILYKVVGSSKNAISMKLISNSMMSLDGIARFFLNIDGQGVLIIRNISEAAELGMISKEEVDNIWCVFSMNTLMVSSLIWFKNNNSVVLGFVYLTSDSNVFNANHVDDLIALSESISPKIIKIVEQFHGQRLL